MAQANSSTPLFFNVAGVGSWSTSIPYDVAAVGGRQATEILNLAVVQAVEWFIEEYMPLRFNPGYARSKLGYVILGSSFKKKFRRAQARFPEAINPNVWTGETKRLCLQTARPQTTRIGGSTKMVIGCKIAMNLPGYLNQQRGQITNKTLRVITNDEGRRIASKFFDAVATLVSSYNTISTLTRKGKVKTRTSVHPSVAAQFGQGGRATVVTVRKSA